MVSFIREVESTSLHDIYDTIRKRAFKRAGVPLTMTTKEFLENPQLFEKLTVALTEEMWGEGIKKAIRASPTSVGPKLITAMVNRQAKTAARTKVIETAAKTAIRKHAPKIVLAGAAVLTGGTAAMAYGIGATVDTLTDTTNAYGTNINNFADVLNVTPEEFCYRNGFSSEIRQQVITQYRAFKAGKSITGGNTPPASTATQ